MPAWHSFLDHSPHDEIIYGKARDIRVDDWLLDIPMMLAQTAHEPSFPRINTHLGLGANMMAPQNMPVWNASLIFHPGNWGFLVGNDFGISWLWWSKYFGLLLSMYLVLWTLTRNSLHSALGSLIFLYAPHTQFWTLHNYEPIIHAAISFVALIFLMESPKKSTVLLSALLFTWSSISFAIDNIYPPFQITSAVFFGFLTLAYGYQNGVSQFSESLRNLRITSLLLSLGIIALGGFVFWEHAKEAISLIANTAYPGKRVSLGGNYPLQNLFSQNLLIASGIVKDWAVFGNFCEAAHFIFFFPVVLISIPFTPFKKFEKSHLIFYSCITYLFFILLYTYVGFPKWIAEMTLFSKNAVNRTQIGMGLAEICLLTVFLQKKRTAPTRKELLRILGLTTLFIVSFALFFSGRVLVSHKLNLIVPVVIYLVLSYLLITPKKATPFLFLFTTLSMIYTFHFNPIVRGGNEYLQHNPLAEKLKEIDGRFDKKSNWVVFGDTTEAWVTGNYFRILGISAIVGYFPQPQVGIFKPFDKDGKFASIYNQCAHVRFVEAQSEEATFPFEPGQIRVRVSPKAQGFKDLKVTHFLFTEGAPEYLKKDSSFKLVDSFQGKDILELVSH